MLKPKMSTKKAALAPDVDDIPEVMYTDLSDKRPDRAIFSIADSKSKIVEEKRSILQKPISKESTFNYVGRNQA